MAASARRSYAVFGIHDFRCFWFARLCLATASNMLVVAIGWDVYDTARETLPIPAAALMLGWVGLVQFVPHLLLALPAGYIADHFDRRLVVRLCILIEIIAVGALLFWSFGPRDQLWPLFVVAAIYGAVRSVQMPTMGALGPNLVPRDLLPSAIAFNSLAFQIAVILGPSLGGYLYAVSPTATYGSCAGLLGVAQLLFLLIRPVARPPVSDEPPWQAAMQGLRYVRRNRIVLGAISLDLFACLLGGATALLPVYARDVLAVGPEGFGHLRAAPAVGALLVAALLSRWPIERHVGAVLFGCVALYGCATIAFGLSTWMPLSLATLAVLGGADMVSIYIRHTMIQVHTPDHMRGRVAAVSSVFIGASNELGEFESGVTARWFGAVPAVVLGGVLAVLVTIGFSFWFPELRRTDMLRGPEGDGPEDDRQVDDRPVPAART